MPSTSVGTHHRLYIYELKMLSKLSVHFGINCFVFVSVETNELNKRCLLKSSEFLTFAS